MRKLLLSTTILTVLATSAYSADIYRVHNLCAKRLDCVSAMAVSIADLRPALLVEGGTSLSQRNPDPFHQFNPQPTMAQQPGPQQQAPQTQVQLPPGQTPVIVQAPQQPEGWLGWVLAAIAAVFTGSNIFGNFRKNSDDPNAARILALQIAQRGLNSPLVDNMINFPGEDIVERIANRVIQQRLAALGVTQGAVGPILSPGPGMVAVPADKMTGLLDGVEKLISRLGQGVIQGAQQNQPRT